MSYIDCPPNAYALMDSIRSMGYTLETAVADILDNSIAAQARNIDIYYQHSPVEYVAIIDDGEGMDNTQMRTAMQYGGNGTGNLRDRHDLGRFGLGLKTASLSQCDKLTVISKKKDNDLVGMRWDLQHVNAVNAWDLEVLSTEDMHSLPMSNILDTRASGTMVLWEALEPMKQGEDRAKDILSAKMDAVEKHLSLVFHRYIAGEDELGAINIRMNGACLTPVNPFYGGDIFSPPTLLLPSEVMLTTYLMPHASKLSREDKEQLGITQDMRQHQGFYVYRNKRLIQWGEWYRGVMPRDKISELLRFRIDISNACENDKEWMLDVKKSQITPPNMSLEILKQIGRKIHDEVKGSWVRQELSSMDDGEEKLMWERHIVEPDKKVFYKINETHPLVESVKAGLTRKGARDFDKLLKLLAKTIPIHQMTLDCEQDAMDEKVQLSREEAKQLMDEYLEQFSGEERELQKDIMRLTVPFSYYQDLFE